ncbi:hypothetical protein AEQU3_03501 [Aequorivita antarctica]|nr:hypothetical protein AEQU3_03501 [Aequorivita antarctica]
MVNAQAAGSKIGLNLCGTIFGKIIVIFASHSIVELGIPIKDSRAEIAGNNIIKIIVKAANTQ